MALMVKLASRKLCIFAIHATMILAHTIHVEEDVRCGG